MSAAIEPVTTWEDIRQGDCVKVRVGNERLWFEVLGHSVTEGQCNSVICRLSSVPAEDGIVFDGRVTIDRDWIIEAARKAKPKLRLVS